MKSWWIIVTSLSALSACREMPSTLPGKELISGYVREFNADDEEYYSNKYPNSAAEAFLTGTIPVFDCPDKSLMRTYYFRWWTFRKHIRQTPYGEVITEFLPDVSWSKAYNTISCPAAHHIRESRWLKEKSTVSDYCRFWFLCDKAEPRKYSFPYADAVWQCYKVTGSRDLIEDLFPKLEENWREWEVSHRDSTGLFWQTDWYDGMEISVSGQLSRDASGYRPTINSYAYADAVVLGKMASLLGMKERALFWQKKAEGIKTCIWRYLWDGEEDFFKVVPRFADMTPSPARELSGYVPWMYGLGSEEKGASWRELFDTCGFKAPFGPTTVERRDPGFAVEYSGHECQWNGPSWPFATSQTLTAMAECYHIYGEKFFSRSEYFDLLKTYSESHRISDGNGVRKRCWIDEDLDPFTGEWIARFIIKNSPEALSPAAVINERGKDYNHSTFCDLIISGLVGIVPQDDGSIRIEPMVPESEWDWFCLKGVVCRNREITVMYDRDGSHYHGAKGFNVYVDGQLKAHRRKYSCAAAIIIPVSSNQQKN